MKNYEFLQDSNQSPVVNWDRKAEINKTLACLEVKLCTPMFFGLLKRKMTLIFEF
jgi:hypothetical protein